PCATDGGWPGGESCFGEGPVAGWAGQSAVNGEWRRFTGAALDQVSDGAVVAQSATWDQYLASDGKLRVQADAYAKDCIDTAYGQPLSDGVAHLGLVKGILCLGDGTAHPAGRVDVTYPGPDFAAGSAGTQTSHAQCPGGQGGRRSVTTDTLCVVKEDCPSGETCATTGGAFRLRYTIEKVP